MALGNRQNDYCNEKVFQRNRLPSRSYHIPDTSLLLNGKWDFNYVSVPAAVPDPTTFSQESHPVQVKTAIEKEDFEPSDTLHKWAPIDVPGHWQLQGYGRPQYTNVPFPFPACPPHAPTENPTGTYRRTFNVPDSWDPSSQFRLRFDGVDSAYYVWLNGVEVGYSQGSRNAAEFDVSSLINKIGPNCLLVSVLQWCDGSYIEDQDQWWLSGIFRDVHLLAYPSQARIDDFFTKTELDQDYKDAKLHIELDLTLKENCGLSFTLRDAQNSIVKKTQNISVLKGTKKATHSLDVPNPSKWTAETPYLYTIEIELLDVATHSIIQNIHHRVGFRTVEIKNGNICVNGKAILIRGTNRHDHHPHHGRAVDYEFVRHDLLLMKRHNINAIRCSHYPSYPRLVELADELGFWVIDEADLECHGFDEAVGRTRAYEANLNYADRQALTFRDAASFTSDNPDWEAAYIDRMTQLVERDKNHPSVVIWSLGNEAFYGRNHAAMYHWAKKRDPGRPIHYEGDREAATADMYSYMYPSVDSIIEMAQEEGDDFKKPIILCEYGHAMGNGPGWLEDYQAAFRKYRRLQGGFIWEWANHGLWKEDVDGKKYYAYGGDFGDVPNDGTFVMDGLCYSDHTPTPGLVELKKVIAPVRAWIENGAVVVSNEYDFTSLDHLKASYKIEAFGDGSKVLKAGTLDLPSIHAGQKESIPLPKEIQELSSDEECWLTFDFVLKKTATWAEAGHTIAWCQSRLQTAKPKPVQTIAGALQVQTSDLYHTIQGGDFHFVFNRALGQLVSWTYKGRSLLLTSPSDSPILIPDFWRPKTDNDERGQTQEWQLFGLDYMTSQLRSFTISHQPSSSSLNSVTLTAVHYLAPPILAWGFEATITYTITSPNGILTVNTHLKPSGLRPPPTLARVGLNIQLDPSLTNASWLGIGPGESYSDKQTAQRFGLHSEPSQVLQTRYDVPQEYGNHTLTRWLKLHDKSAQRGFKVRITQNEVVDSSNSSSSATTVPTSPATHDDNDQTFDWAALLYDPSTVMNAKHPCDLVPRQDDSLLLRLDCAHAGLGTAACGPGVREDLKIKTHERRFEFVFVPFAS